MAKGKKGKKKQQTAAKARSITDQAMYNVSVPDALLSRAEKDLVREAYMTPYTVAQKYNVTISTARKLLKMLEEKGVLKLYSKSRRSPVYVPAK